MFFSVLTEVCFRHLFFADNRYAHINMYVPQATAIDMRRHGLLFRRQRDGFVLLYDQSVYDSRESLLKEGLQLEFDMVLNDEQFYNYTALTQADISNSILLFTNHTTGKLHVKETVSEMDVQMLPVYGMRKPFGRIRLQVDNTLQLRHEICFAAKPTRWCYFLMSDQLAALDDPAVIDTSGNVEFEGPLLLDLPGKPAVRMFISVTPLLLAERPVHTFQLVEHASEGNGYTVIIAALPAPDISRISFSSVPGYDRLQTYSEIFLY
ncbi:MAG TPA: hypothetical protein VJ720_08180 [Chitinophaga sp.]|nr:hypothetical protein [Chitinophaga sp.]